MKPLYVKKNGVVYKISGTGIPSIYPAANVEYDNTVTSELQATDVQGAIDELSTRQDTNTKNTAYGTCDTAGNVKDKVATLSNATNWVLEVGTIVGIRFTYTNTYTPSSGNNVTLNVNNTGAKNIRYSDGIGTGTSDAKNPTAYGEAGQTIYYMYDGTYWVWVSHSKDNDTLYNFKGNEFRSADGNNYGQETGYGGNANYMVVNGHYYYNSNGPSTDIGASANDGAIYVQAYDEDNVTQIAQNYETGNLFVRSKVNGSWTEWKKTIANITGNNTVLTTDKTPFLTRQTLNPTGFSGYVREKLIGASYAWNNQLINGNFATTDDWFGRDSNPISVSGNILTLTTTSGSLKGLQQVVSKQKILANHKYLLIAWVKSSIACSNVDINMATTAANKSISANVWTQVSRIWTYSSDATSGLYVLLRGSFSGGETIQYKEVQIIDLTLAFGSTIADYLYGLSNNGGITKLRDMGCPIDKYAPYGYGLYSSKPSAKKVVGKNLFDGTVYENKRYSKADGSLIASNNYLASINPMYVYGSTKNFVNYPVFRTYYDSGMNFISADSTGSAVVSTPSNAYYMHISQDNVRLIPSTCIVAISETEIAFEPYSCTTYSLGNDELRGKFDLVNGEIVASGDVKESNGNVTRNWAEIDLSSLTFGYNATQKRYEADLPNAKSVGAGRSADIICSKYATDVNATSGDNWVCFQSGCTIFVYDASQSGAPSGKCVYMLATPTTEQSTPFADPMSMVGATTEEYIDTRDIPCPVGAERQYMGQSEDVVEIPSSPQSDGKRVLISEVSGGKEQVYWDIPKLYYKEYTVQGDGTKTYGDLLAELKPYYETLSEDEKTYSKVMMRATSSGNECLTFVGNYWYSRMGVNASGLWLDQIDFQYNRYFKQVSGGSITEETNTITHNVIALRVLTYTRAES